MFNSSTTINGPELFSAKLSDGSCIGFPISELKRWSYFAPAGILGARLDIWLGSNTAPNGIGLIALKDARAVEVWEALEKVLVAFSQGDDDEDDYDDDELWDE